MQKKLLDIFSHPGKVYSAGREELLPVLTKKQRENLIHSKNSKQIDYEIKTLEKKGIHFMHRESSEYPERLLQIYDPPSVLYYIGRLPDFSFPLLAMVGARQATIYGRNMAERFAFVLAEQGVQIISGLAAGVDAASHRGALEGSGYTVGVLGGGIDTIYPRENYHLYQKLYQGGCVISEYNLGIPNQKGLFPLRNRIISGLSDGVFVVEAGIKSGSLITADQGLEQGKDIFALPGRITDRLSQGCNRLISQGAILVREPQDILEILPDIPDQKKKEASALNPMTGTKMIGTGRKTEITLEENQRRLYDLLDEIHPLSFNELLEKSGLPLEKLQHILLELEMENLIIQPQQNIYLLK